MIEAKFIEDAIRKNEHWRAKERLQGRLSQNIYDPGLFESYGFALLAMNDTVEAGKYLFLSGARDQSYMPAIDAYLSRYSGKGMHHIAHTFPKAAQSAPFSSYPKIVIEELQAQGFSAKDVQKELRSEPESGSSGSLGLVGSVVVTVVFALFIGFLTSALRGLAWLYGWLANVVS
ncbi:MAG: hypothetical protein AAFY56_17390 [Pseudomonadota bacterium]